MSTSFRLELDETVPGKSCKGCRIIIGLPSAPERQVGVFRMMEERLNEM
jgi:hypothetical protein